MFSVPFVMVVVVVILFCILCVTCMIPWHDNPQKLLDTNGGHFSEISDEEKNKNGSKHVIIMGGGLSGLTTAFYLKKKYNFKVTLFEKFDFCGGICKGQKIESSGLCIDQSFHGIGAYYTYFLLLLKDLNILNRLIAIENYVFYNECTSDISSDYIDAVANGNFIQFINWLYNFYFKVIYIKKCDYNLVKSLKIALNDGYLLFKMYLLSKYTSVKRRYNEIDSISVKQFVKNGSFELKMIIASVINCIGGLDGLNTSLAVILRILDTDAHFLDYYSKDIAKKSKVQVYSLSGPTQFELINPLVAKCIELGVNIKTKCCIKQVICDKSHNNKISGIKYTVNDSNELIHMQGDYFVNAMDIVNSRKVFNADQNFEHLKSNLDILYNGYMKQYCQINFLFDYKLRLPNKSLVVGIRLSENKNKHKKESSSTRDLLDNDSFCFRRETEFWTPKYFGKRNKDGNNVKECLAFCCGCVNESTKWSEMSKQDLVDKYWNFFKYLNTAVFKNAITHDKYSDVVLYDQYNESNKEQLIDESCNKNRCVIGGLWKLAPNANIYKYQMNSKDYIYNNLYHCSSHLTRTEKRTDSMDTAVEAAHRCVINIVFDNYNDHDSSNVKYQVSQCLDNVHAPKRRSLFQVIAKRVDQLLFDYNVKYNY